MKKIFFILLFIISTGIIYTTYSQNIIFHDANFWLKKTGEVYFKFTIDDKKKLQQLTKIISIDNVKNDTIYAYANEQEFNKFLLYNYSYLILPHPGYQPNAAMYNNKSTVSWDAYPTYPIYESMMSAFQTNYPQFCKLYHIGNSVNGRKILFVKITSNVNQSNYKPRVMFTSTMHGDETVGYVLMLRLIDYLLSNYTTDAFVARLVDSVELWICPLLNPDGTYYGGDYTVANARRYNANSVDINRNYPDPVEGNHPDFKPYQPEVLAIMGLTDTIQFTVSANFHTGDEVVNYPWDHTSTLHADDDWWQYVSRQYADTVHKYSPVGYMDGFNNGITNGYDWYCVYGGQQDYMNYFKRCREITVELSVTKNPLASMLPLYWNYNYHSFLNYIEMALYGIKGTTTDSSSLLPVKSNIFIQNHDNNHSDIYSYPSGYYFRPIYSGNYSINYSADCYQSKITQIQVSNRSSISNQIVLRRLPIAKFSFTQHNDTVYFTNLSIGATSYSWKFSDGMTSSLATPIFVTSSNNFTATLIAYDACGIDSTTTNILVNINRPSNRSDFIVFFNTEKMSFSVNSTNNSNLLLYDISGKLVFTYYNQNADYIYIPPIKAGIYILNYSSSLDNIYIKVFVQ